MEEFYHQKFETPAFKRPVEPEFKILRKEVNKIVKQNSRKLEHIIRIKIILFPALYVVTYGLLLTAGGNPVIFYTAYFLLGVFLLLNFLNLIHDAVHGVLFRRNERWNKLYLYFFDLLGANSYIWKIRHIKLHHMFPNIRNWDSDFEHSPLVRVFPESPARKIHRYQHIYLPFLYPFYLFNWLLIRDFKDFFQKDRIVRKVTKIPRREYLKLFLFKALFFSYILIIPKFVLGVSWWMVLGGFLVMMFTASVLSLVVLLSPHANVDSNFPEPDESGNITNTWFLHQLICTNDVSNNNFFIRFFMGSFNYHIAHHLFPDIHHSLYPKVTEVLEKFCREHDLPYRKQSLTRSLLNHYLLLKKNAFTENIFEETM